MDLSAVAQDIVPDSQLARSLGNSSFPWLELWFFSATGGGGTPTRLYSASNGVAFLTSAGANANFQCATLTYQMKQVDITTTPITLGTGTYTGAVITNAGAGGTIVLNLPDYSSGSGQSISYRFVRVAAQRMTVNPANDDRITYSGETYPGEKMAAGEAIYLDSAGAKLELVWEDATGVWVAAQEFGTLTEETP
ncbi:MAG: hypothetical protein FD152_4510 [Xanthobacteraceae bacterium]|nr:MAG: hypothetical protein FD152_4510 [Xanthobacteraceae bacterium]